MKNSMNLAADTLITYRSVSASSIIRYLQWLSDQVTPQISAPTQFPDSH